jgi:hypothetical protein
MNYINVAEELWEIWEICTVFWSENLEEKTFWETKA